MGPVDCEAVEVNGWVGPVVCEIVDEGEAVDCEDAVNNVEVEGVEGVEDVDGVLCVVVVT